MGCLLLVAAGVLMYVIHTSSPPSGNLEAARLALDGVHVAEGPRYAKAETEIAETYFQQAARAYRMAEVRLFGFLDYDEVAQQIEEARAKADEAMAVASRRRDELRARAQEMIAAAEAGLKEAQDGLEKVPTLSVVRASMARAEVALREARQQFVRGDFSTATDRAAVARAGLDSVNQKIDSFLTEYTTGARTKQWQRWVSDTLRESRDSHGPVIIVDKMKHLCHLYRSGLLVKSYRVDLGTSQLLPKTRAGDRATPEGRYYVTKKRGRGQTAYYKALMIDYPNAEDRVRFDADVRNGEVSRRARLGGLIEIHGEGGRNEDWTLGCVALDNRDMDHLFHRVDVGTPVTIVGTIP